MDTKERILETSIEMFSESGYSDVSIRDIAGTVGIKESSIYYHFKSKQDILDTLVRKYEEKIQSLVKLMNSAPENISSGESISATPVNSVFFEEYLFDPFCNRMMRIFMLEQFKSKEMETLYNRYIFELPRMYQRELFDALGKIGVISKKNVNKAANDYYCAITMLTFKYLLNGELTDAKKSAFMDEAEKLTGNIFEGEHHD